MVLLEVAEGQAELPVPNPSCIILASLPLEKLLGHRTTADLPETADIIIVGSSSTGSFAAHFLKDGKGPRRPHPLDARGPRGMLGALLKAGEQLCLFSHLVGALLFYGTGSLLDATLSFSHIVSRIAQSRRLQMLYLRP